MSGVTETNYKADVETRIGETMRTSGVSITITSLTDLLAFAAGASSIFLSVRNFCIYSGTCFYTPSERRKRNCLSLKSKFKKKSSNPSTHK